VSASEAMLHSLRTRLVRCHPLAGVRLSEPQPAGWKGWQEADWGAATDRDETGKLAAEAKAEGVEGNAKVDGPGEAKAKSEHQWTHSIRQQMALARGHLLSDHSCKVQYPTLLAT
jgi:hypothetical protein